MNSAPKTVSAITCIRSYQTLRHNFKHNRKLSKKLVKKRPWFRIYSSNHKSKMLQVLKVKVKNRLMICSTISS